METQQSYKFLTDLGLAQYDATVRQYMEQTFAKKGETPSGSGVNVVEATLEPGEKEEDWKISEMSHTPDQIWDMLQTKQAVVIAGAVQEEGTIIFTPLEFVEFQAENKDEAIGKTEVQGVSQEPKQKARKSISKYIIFTASYGPQTLFIEIIYHKNDKTGEYQWDTECGIENIEIKPPYEQINWQDLKDRRDKGDLEPGKQYCIMDYEFTCTQAGVGPAAHYFGIIVTADDYDKLNENARAIYIGDSYFQNCNLSAWELKYCLDNDKDRFQWAQWGKMNFGADHSYIYKLVRKEDAYWKWKFTDEKFENYTYVYTIPNPSTNDHIYDTYDFNELTKYLPAAINNIEGEGKGVIYWMRDEWGNECPYDFKNAMFRNPGYFGKNLKKDAFYYTFSSDSGISLYDKSTLPKQAINNIIKDYRGVIPVNIFLGSHSSEQAFTLTANNELGQNCTNNVFGENCYGNRFGNNCTDNSFGDYVRDNVAVAYLQNCWIGDQSWGNKFGTNCVGIRAPKPIKFIGNTFGDDVNGMDFSKVGIKPKKDQCITNTIVYSGTQGLPTFKLDYSNDIPKFIGITQRGAVICVQGIDGFGGGGNTAPLSVAVKLNEYGQFVSADYYLSSIWKAIEQNRPIFMHVYSSADEILFLQLSKINKNAALFSSFCGGEYYECLITEKPADCWFTQNKVITEIWDSINDLDERVTALEGDTPDQYDVTLTYDGVEVPATVEVTGEEPIRASGLRWTVKIVECIDYPQLVGVELTGTGESIEDTTFTGEDAAGKPITANIKQNPKYVISIENKTAGTKSNCTAELINTRQDKTEGWLYDMKTDKCDEYPELVRDGFMLKNPTEDKIDNATGSFTTDKGEVLSLSVVIK